MPLTKKGTKIMASMKRKYGKKKGKSVFYASANKGVIRGVHGSSPFSQQEMMQGFKRISGADKLKLTREKGRFERSPYWRLPDYVA